MKIVVYPKDSNPYQSLLYDGIKIREPSLKVSYAYNFPYVGSLPLLAFASVKRLLGYRIIHIHWPSFGTRLPFILNKRIAYVVFLLTLKWLDILGYKVIWTVHNVLPHEPQTIDDLTLMKRLALQSNAKIVHSKLTIDQMRGHGINTSNVHIIPHGNYIQTYPTKISVENARSILGISQNEFVILFFGQIRPYKGVEYLLDALNSIEHYHNVRLVIAGKCSDVDLSKEISATKSKITIDFHEGRVDDNDVAIYFKACDVVCLPFKAITTSGSALLALSFGKPLIAPSVGALAELPHNVGYLYDPNKHNALALSLNSAIENKAELSMLGDNGLEYAETLNWGDIGQRTLELYKKVLSESS